MCPHYVSFSREFFLTMNSCNFEFINEIKGCQCEFTIDTKVKVWVSDLSKYENLFSTPLILELCCIIICL